MFIDHRLSTKVAMGFTGGPEWSTAIVEMDNGREVRNGQWMYPRHRYSAEYPNLLDGARREVLEAFHAARGRLHAFRFHDFNDADAEGAPLLPEIGTTTPVQLVKTYQLGSATSSRLIQAPMSCVVRDSSGTPVAGSVDTTTGLFTPASAWEDDAFSWSGEFDVWVRFDSDYNAFTLADRSRRQFMGTANIELVEVRR